MLARAGGDFPSDIGKRRTGLSLEQRIGVDCGCLQSISGQIEPPLARMEGNRPQKARQREADAGVTSRRLDPRPAGAKQRGSERHERGRSALGIAFERPKIGRRSWGEVEFPRLDQAMKRRARQLRRADRRGQTERHRVLAHGALRHLVDRIAPPLEADLAEHGLAHRLAYPRDFEVERVQRKQPIARPRRREERRQIAVMIGAPHLIAAVGGRMLSSHGRARRGVMPYKPSTTIAPQAHGSDRQMNMHAAAATPPPASPSKTTAGENFPVGSRLIAAPHRPVVAAFYRFARLADDIADDRSMSSDAKVSRLQALDAVLLGGEPSGDDDAQRAAIALRGIFHERRLSIDHPRHLLQAFLADAANRSCRGWSDLLAYCRYSAAPVGRFLLDLHGEPRDAWPASDALCAALQILNHLQDCQDDWRRLRRLYVPSDWLAAAGVAADALLMSRASPALRGVLDRVLDGVDQLNATAAPLPALIRQRGLRMEAAAIVAISRKLARKLRRRDPLARRVALARVEKLAAMASGIAHGWRAR